MPDTTVTEESGLGRPLVDAAFDEDGLTTTTLAVVELVVDVVDMVERLLTEEAVEKVVHDDEPLELVVDVLDVVVDVVVGTELEVVEVVDREVVLVLIEVELLELEVATVFPPPATFPLTLTELLVL